MTPPGPGPGESYEEPTVGTQATPRIAPDPDEGVAPTETTAVTGAMQHTGTTEVTGAMEATGAMRSSGAVADTGELAATDPAAGTGAMSLDDLLGEDTGPVLRPGPHGADRIGGSTTRFRLRQPTAPRDRPSPASAGLVELPYLVPTDPEAAMLSQATIDSEVAASGGWRAVETFLETLPELRPRGPAPGRT